ncbi:MAG: DUF3179 domain-containing (seleno)protein [Candidatus Latescibacteria bacterium]|nr:DUF3179 domain-containing (seleno)protein [Candidatus Latescibacterota bacterium]
MLAGSFVSSSFAFLGCGGDAGPGPEEVGSQPITSPSADSTVTRSWTSFPKNFLSVDLFPFDQIIDPGVGKDGIPALTDPTWITRFSTDVAYLRDSDLVLGVVVHGEARAYPHNILWWHEIINDRISSYPVIASLCPLTGTGMVFSGRGDGPSGWRWGCPVFCSTTTSSCTTGGTKKTLSRFTPR